MFIRALLVFVFSCASVLIGDFSFGQELGPTSVPRARPDSSKHSALEQQLVKLNEEMLAAQVRADIAALDEFLTDDYTRTHAVGRIENKADFLNDLKTGNTRFLAVDVTDVDVRVYGTAAVLVGHARQTTAENPETGITFTAVWVQQDHKWRVAAWTTTRIPQRASDASAGR